MDYEYEMIIETKDRNKVIRYGGNNAHMHFVDTYNSAGAVIGDEPDQTTENNIVIGKISVPDMEWEEVVRIMIEDAGLMTPIAEKGLTEDKDISFVS